MSSVCQSTAMLLAGKEKRGLANSTYYIGLDLGMTLGPMIGGALYGALDIRWFYPALMVTMPLAGAVYFVTMRKNGSLRRRMKRKGLRDESEKINRDEIKYIAMMTMLLNHIANIFLEPGTFILRCLWISDILQLR